MQTTWNQFYKSLSQINYIRITRNINPDNKGEEFDLFGFGDVSEKAYGAYLYAVYQNKKRAIESHCWGPM